MPISLDKLPIISTLVGTVITGLLAFNTYKVSEFDTKLRKDESERAVNFKIYDSISAAIESSDPKQIRAARVLVQSLASAGVKEGFLAALETGEKEIYDSEEALVTRTPLTNTHSEQQSTGAPDISSKIKWSNWNYDIFWCSDSGVSAEGLARSLASAISNDGAKGRVRNRVLPTSIKSRPSYIDLKGFEIRYEASEFERANELRSFAQRTTGVNFNLKEINPETKTTSYLSAFICPVT